MVSVKGVLISVNGVNMLCCYVSVEGVFISVVL